MHPPPAGAQHRVHAENHQSDSRRGEERQSEWLARETKQRAVGSCLMMRVGVERGGDEINPDDCKHDAARNDPDPAQAHGPSLFGRTPPFEIEILAEGPAPCGYRSEEHTSELQSLLGISYAVFCLDRKSVV